MYRVILTVSGILALWAFAYVITESLGALTGPPTERMSATLEALAAAAPLFILGIPLATWVYIQYWYRFMDLPESTASEPTTVIPVGQSRRPERIAWAFLALAAIPLVAAVVWVLLVHN